MRADERAQRLKERKIEERRWIRARGKAEIEAAVQLFEAGTHLVDQQHGWFLIKPDGAPDAEHARTMQMSAWPAGMLPDVPNEGPIDLPLDRLESAMCRFAPTRDVLLSHGGAQLRLLADRWSVDLSPALARSPPPYIIPYQPILGEPAASRDEAEAAADNRLICWVATPRGLWAQGLTIEAHIALSLVWQALSDTLPFDLASIIFDHLLPHKTSS